MPCRLILSVTLARSRRAHETAAADAPHEARQFEVDQACGSSRARIEPRTPPPARRDRRPRPASIARSTGSPEPLDAIDTCLPTRAPRRAPARTRAPLRYRPHVSTIFAPSRISAWPPRFRPLSTLPGTAMTSRPCSSAHAAVMSDPDFSDASITTTARDRPLIRRLRMRKVKRQRRRAGRILADDEARSRRSRRASGACSARIDAIDARAEHRDRPARRQRAAVRRRIDAARQAADDGDAARGQVARRAARPFRAPPTTRRASRRSPRPARRSASSVPAIPEHRRDSRASRRSAAGNRGSFHASDVNPGRRGATRERRAPGRAAARPVRASSGSSAGGGRSGRRRDRSWSSDRATA